MVFDLNRYMGKWYELLKIPFSWESNCVESFAEYENLGNGKISLKNTCVIDENKSYSREGVGYESNIHNHKHDTVMKKLTIEFTDGLPSDGPSPYWVHWTDYEYSLVGGPGDDKLWVLGREKKIPFKKLSKILELVNDLDYKSSKLELQNNVKIL